LYSSFTLSDAPDAALPVSNGSETIAPKIPTAAVSNITSREMPFLLSVLPVAFILPRMLPPTRLKMGANNFGTSVLTTP
jgi:hypothetical protein